MEITNLRIILQRYTFKIIQYYIDNKGLPSSSQLMQMQQEAIDQPIPEDAVFQLITPRRKSD